MYEIPHSEPAPKTVPERVEALEGEVATLKRTVATLTRILERKAAAEYHGAAVSMREPLGSIG